MAREKLTLRGLVVVLGLLAAPCLALAQEMTTAGPKDLTRSAMDPVDKITGMWQVDKVDGSTSSDTLVGTALKIDRQSVTTLESGSCTNPSFVEQLGTIAIACVGQGLATASFDPQSPGKLQWTEGGLSASLHRISGTETLQSPPAAGDQTAPAEQGGSDAGEGETGEGEGGEGEQTQ